ncbi:MAG: RadC family protein [Myxococcales bacterium]
MDEQRMERGAPFPRLQAVQDGELSQGRMERGAPAPRLHAVRDGELSKDEMPRERLLAHGGEVLSDAELIAALLGTGTRGAAALEVARELMASYGDLPSIGRAAVSDLASRRGVGPARACALAAALEIGRRAQAPRRRRHSVRCSWDIYAYYGPRLVHLTNECFFTMCLDAKHRVLRDARIVQGGLTSCLVLPREAYAPALQEGAAAVAFVHNHPSGDPTPSADDLTLTARLKKAGEVLGISLLDHLIIGEGRYVSLRDAGQL